MNCREFEKLWNDLLDARCEPSSHLERGMEVHASACPRCRAVSDRYQLLRQAISGLRVPTPSAESIDRLYALTVPASPPTIPIGASRPRLRLRAPLAAAAAFVLAWLGGNFWPACEPVGPPPATRLAPAIGQHRPHRPLGLALAEATEATLDLAREASAPASRIGREMFDLGRFSTSGTDVPPGPDEPEEGEDPDSAASGLFKAVGERVGAGVKPFSGSARHAFGFLLGQPDEQDPVPVPSGRNSL
jgi:hypothetical protein